MAKKVETPAKKAASPAKKAAATTSKPAVTAAKAQLPAKKAAATKTATKTVATPSPKTAAAPAASVTTKEPTLTPHNKTAAPAAKKAPAAAPAALTAAAVKGETKEGIKYTKDFDAKFLTAQHKLLIEARVSLTGQAVRLEDEANSLIDDEMGDVQFDDESGEGDTMVVERERDLFLSARARQDIEEIDAALARLMNGTYGYSVVSLRPIPRERLEAIPWATELTEEKVGGIGRR
jgi:RNA polymerase-binding transcription factor DksA